MCSRSSRRHHRHRHRHPGYLGTHSSSVSDAVDRSKHEKDSIKGCEISLPKNEPSTGSDTKTNGKNDNQASQIVSSQNISGLEQHSMDVEESMPVAGSTSGSESLCEKRELNLVLDLDNTLLHAVPVETLQRGSVADDNFNLVIRRLSEEIFPIEVANKKYLVKPRPGLRGFLKAMSDAFNLFVCTAASWDYASAVIEKIDPDKSLFYKGNSLRCIARNTDTGIPQSPFGADSELKKLERVLQTADEESEKEIKSEVRKSVILDDRPAAWTRDDRKLIVVPDFYAYFDFCNIQDWVQKAASEAVPKGQGHAVSSVAVPEDHDEQLSALKEHFEGIAKAWKNSEGAIKLEEAIKPKSVENVKVWLLNQRNIHEASAPLHSAVRRALDELFPKKQLRVPAEPNDKLHVEGDNILTTMTKTSETKFYVVLFPSRDDIQKDSKEAMRIKEVFQTRFDKPPPPKDDEAAPKNYEVCFLSPLWLLRSRAQRCLASEKEFEVFNDYGEYSGTLDEFLPDSKETRKLPFWDEVHWRFYSDRVKKKT